MSLKKKSNISSILLATFFFIFFVDRFRVRKGGQFYEAVFSQLVYDRNCYFDLGPIPKPKPKLDDDLGRYRNRYQNHTSKQESSF